MLTARLFVECLSSRVLLNASSLTLPPTSDDPVLVGEMTPTGIDPAHTTPTETTSAETISNETTANDWVLVVGPKDGETGETTTLYNEVVLNVPKSLGLGITKATVIQKVTITEFWKVTNPEIGSQYTAKEIKAAEPIVVNIGIYYEKGETRTWEGGLTVGGERKKMTVAPAVSYAKSKFEANGGYTEVAITLTSDKYKDKDVKVDGVVKWYKISYEYEVKDGQSKFLRTEDDRKSAGLTIAQLENQPTKTEEIGTNVLKARVWTKDAAPEKVVIRLPVTDVEAVNGPITPPEQGGSGTDQPTLTPDQPSLPPEADDVSEVGVMSAPAADPVNDPLTDPLFVG